MTEVGEPAANELRRALGYWDLVVYGLAYIAPFAPLSTLGFVWQASHGLIVLAYLLGSVCMYFTARSYAVMTAAMPSAGSVYGFARMGLGPFAGFMAGWMILLDYLLIPAFVYVLIAVAFEELLPGIDRSVWIVLLSLFTLAVNWFGITVTSGANFIAVGIQALVVVVLLAFSLVALSHGFGSGGLTLAPLYAHGVASVHDVFNATSICIMSFLGFDAISTLSEEVRDRDRNVVGRAIISVLVISAAFFMVVTFILGNLLPGVVIHDPAAAVYDLTREVIGAWAAVALAWIYASVVGLSNALPMQVGVARVLFAMGRDRQLPHVLSKVHPHYRTPWVSMLVTAVLSTAVGLAMRNRMDDLATIVNFGALCGFLLLHAAVIKEFILRRRSRHWGVHLLVPLAGIAVVMAVLAGMSPLAVTVGVSWMAIGAAWGAVLQIRHRVH